MAKYDRKFIMKIKSNTTNNDLP